MGHPAQRNLPSERSVYKVRINLVKSDWPLGAYDSNMHTAIVSQSTDKQIRPLLRELIHYEHASNSTLRIYEEFAIWGGDIRADFAALNGISAGYEIKSGLDTLSRLPAQRRAYNEVFDEISLVATTCHLDDLRRISPWWGIVAVVSVNGSLGLERIRLASPNPRKNAAAIAALLWRGEALAILESLGLDSGLRSKPMSHLVVALSSELSLEHLSDEVRRTIKLRGDWRAGARQKQCGEMSLLPASRSRFRRTPYSSRLR